MFVRIGLPVIALSSAIAVEASRAEPGGVMPAAQPLAISADAVIVESNDRSAIIVWPGDGFGRAFGRASGQTGDSPRTGAGAADSPGPAAEPGLRGR